MNDDGNVNLAWQLDREYLAIAARTRINPSQYLQMSVLSGQNSFGNTVVGLGRSEIR